jgi:hypothetical protein
MNYKNGIIYWSRFAGKSFTGTSASRWITFLNIIIWLSCFGGLCLICGLLFTTTSYRIEQHYILHEGSEGMVISRGGDVNLPQRSCDLTQIDFFFLWGYLKTQVSWQFVLKVNIIYWHRVNSSGFMQERHYRLKNL